MSNLEQGYESWYYSLSSFIDLSLSRLELRAAPYLGLVENFSTGLAMLTNEWWSFSLLIEIPLAQKCTAYLFEFVHKTLRLLLDCLLMKQYPHYFIFKRIILSKALVYERYTLTLYQIKDGRNS